MDKNHHSKYFSYFFHKIIINVKMTCQIIKNKSKNAK